MIGLADYPRLDQIVDAILGAWPEHQMFARKSVDGRSPGVLRSSDQIAGLILRLAPHARGGLEGLCEDYRFLCETIVLPEELYFRRHGRYRLSTLEEAAREVYANGPFMERYMNGLLLSGVMWSNHAQALDQYLHEYLPSLAPGADHLEIGPGHGLLLYLAASRPEIGSVTAWDVSPTSIANTRAALETLGVGRPVDLVLKNLFDTADGEAPRLYDSIVLSEVLEHLEQPVQALEAIKGWLKPGGRVWVNVPANSPAPDHLFLVDSVDHACELVKAAGLEVEHATAFPMTGTTIEKATRRKLAISCVVTGLRRG